MPPSCVRSIRDLIFWRYAKILSDIAGMGKSNDSFTKEKWNGLKKGDIHFSESIKELVKDIDNPARCIFCGKSMPLSKTHLLPKDRGGPDNNGNAVKACANCRLSKGDRRLYEWYGLESRDTIPNTAEAKYLMLIYPMHEKKGTLNETMVMNLCPRCDMEPLCPEKEVLTVYCLEGCFLKKQFLADLGRESSS